MTARSLDRGSEAPAFPEECGQPADRNRSIPGHICSLGGDPLKPATNCPAGPTTSYSAECLCGHPSRSVARACGCCPDPSQENAPNGPPAALVKVFSNSTRVHTPSGPGYTPGLPPVNPPSWPARRPMGALRDRFSGTYVINDVLTSPDDSQKGELSPAPSSQVQSCSLIFAFASTSTFSSLPRHDDLLRLPESLAPDP
jgi:hypothetical protein